MSRDLEMELRDRLRGAALPAAPARLTERLASVTVERHSSPERGPAGRTRLLMPLAAALAIAVIAISGFGSGPKPSSTPAGSVDAGSTDGGPGTVPFTIESRVGEWCSQMGGCEFHVDLAGPGGPWQGKLDWANLGSPTDITPRLPGRLGHGSYVLSAEIHVFGDAIPEGATGPPDLGTIGACSAAFDVTPETTAVVAALGFWLDRCSAGVVVEDEGTRVSELTVIPSFNGACGEFGCEYRVRLATSMGSWQTVLRSPKLFDEIATGSGIPEALPPGSYLLEASSHRMSDEPSPGSGHRQEDSVAGTCSAQVTVRADERASFEAHVHFRDETCVIEVFTRLAFVDSRPTPTPGTTSPIEGPAGSPSVTCEPNPTHLPGLDCNDVIAEVLAALEPGHAPIETMHVSHQCWSTNPFVVVDCAVERSAIVEVRFAGGSQARRYGVAGDPEGGLTVTLLEPSGVFGPGYPAEPPTGRGLPVERAALSGDGRSLLVQFTAGGCFGDDVPWVGRAGDELLVSIVHVPTLDPVPSGYACAAIGIRRIYQLTLPEPFAGTTVRDLNGDVLVLESAP